MSAAIGNAQTLSIVSGNGQLICSQCPTRAFSYDPLVVMAKDARGNPAANVSVTWTVNNPKGADGRLTSATTTTGADGTSSNIFFMSAPIQFLVPFIQATVTASVPGGSVTFTETNSGASNVTGINAISSSLQSPVPGTNLTGTTGGISTIPIRVSVSSFSPGGPVPGIDLRVVSDPTYPATASCTAPALTDAQGNAACNLQFGNTPGQGKIKIYVGDNYDIYGPFVITVTQGSSTPPPGSPSSLTANPGSLNFVYPGSTTQTVAVTSPSGSVSYTAAVQVGIAAVNWMTVGSPSGPAGSNLQSAFLVTVTPQSLATGTYRANVVLHPNDGTPDVSIPVVLQVNAGGAGTPPGPPSSTSALNVFPSSLTFQYPGAVTQSVGVTAASGTVNYTAAVQVGIASVNWLTVGPPTGPANSVMQSSFQASVVTQNLQPGTYRANIAVHPDNGTADVIVPVVLNVQSVTTAPNLLSAAPGTLNLTHVSGGSVLPAGSISINSSGTGVQFNAITATPWLTVSPTIGTTPGQVVVSVNPTGLQPGSYTGSVTIAASGASNGPQTIAVNLTVQPTQDLQLSTPAISFTAQAGAPPPFSQTVTASAFNGNVPFTVTTAVTSPPGGNWLSATPASGTATGSASPVNVSVNPAGLAAGVYRGTVTFSSPTALTKSQTVDITFLVTALPSPLPTIVANAGSNVPGPVSPGEIISVYGTNLGPAGGISTVVNAGFVETVISEAQVTFDNIPAPLLYVSATQINTVVPYAVAGRATTRMVVTYKNTPSAVVNLTLLDATPGIFANASGQGAIQNQDSSPNSPANPAAKGTVVVIYVTGAGMTTPTSIDGKITPPDVNQLAKPVLPVTVTIGGIPAQVQYAGSAPFLIAGALQVNAVVPDDAPSGDAVQAVVTVGKQDSQPATLSIQ